VYERYARKANQRRRNRLRDRAQDKMREYGVQTDRCHWCKNLMVVYPPNTNPMPPDGRTVDHVLPLAYGGSNLLDNLVYACHQCNHDRSLMSADDLVRRYETTLRTTNMSSPFGEQLWSEDECTVGLPGHECLTDAWLKLFGTNYDPKHIISVEDRGDHTVETMPNNIVVVHSYDGSSIYRKVG